jgi:hypothetical protein
LEPSKFDHVEQGKHVEVWVAKTFDEFQKFKGFPLSKSIGELLEESDLKVFVNMFIMLMLQVIRRNDGLDPPTMIQSLVCAFDYLIRVHEEQHTLEMSCAPLKPFNILIDKQYYKVKLVFNEVVLRFSKVGLARSIKKNDVLIHA